MTVAYKKGIPMWTIHKCEAIEHLMAPDGAAEKFEVDELSSERASRPQK